MKIIHVRTTFMEGLYMSREVCCRGDFLMSRGKDVEGVLLLRRISTVEG